MFKISDNLYFSFSNYTNFKCTYFFANEATFAILATYLWPLTVFSTFFMSNRICILQLSTLKTSASSRKLKFMIFADNHQVDY